MAINRIECVVYCLKPCCQYPAWNFHKYLLGRDGTLVASYPSDVEPTSPQVVHAIEKELRRSAP